MRGLRQLGRGEAGYTLIYVAIVIFALAAMAILAVDISKMLVTRSQLQNAADAGALAGAELFMTPEPPEKAYIEAWACSVAAMNRAYNESYKDPVGNVSDLEAVAITDDTSPDYGTVTVTARSLVSQYFTQVTREMAGHASNPTHGNVAALAAARAGEVGKVKCLMPWSIPDRWDDKTLVPGWSQWRNNGKWDDEEFTDLNGNYMWDPGEPFQDGNDGGKRPGGKDGQYTWEYYHPVYTGYIASRDLGELMTFKVGKPPAAEPSQYFCIDLPIPGQPDVGADRYRWNIANCNPTYLGAGDLVWTENGGMQGPTDQGVGARIAQDPDAYWDPGCQCVKSEFGDDSPRIVFIPLHDPRIPLIPGKTQLLIVKIIAMFLEGANGNGDIQGRFVKVQAQGQQLPPGQHGGGYVYNLSLIR